MNIRHRLGRRSTQILNLPSCLPFLVDDVIHLTSDFIDPGHFRWSEVAEESGALAEFSGIVRSREKGQSIQALFYEVYSPMTENELKKVAEKTLSQFSLEKIQIVHRHGRIAVGEVALWIQVASPHRKEALEAIEFCISQIKQVVPIWKVDPEVA